jgi:hypothetical protein
MFRRGRALPPIDAATVAGPPAIGASMLGAAIHTIDRSGVWWRKPD